MSEQDEQGAAQSSTSAAESQGASPSQGLAFEQARTAYQVIQALLQHTRVTQDLIALMAQVIDEDTTKALTETPHWAAYLDSRRVMERTREQIEQFTEIWMRLSEEAETPAQ